MFSDFKTSSKRFCGCCLNEAMQLPDIGQQRSLTSLPFVTAEGQFHIPISLQRSTSPTYNNMSTWNQTMSNLTRCTMYNIRLLDYSKCVYICVLYHHQISWNYSTNNSSNNSSNYSSAMWFKKKNKTPSISQEKWLVSMVYTINIFTDVHQIFTRNRWDFPASKLFNYQRVTICHYGTIMKPSHYLHQPFLAVASHYILLIKPLFFMG